LVSSHGGLVLVASKNSSYQTFYIQEMVPCDRVLTWTWHTSTDQMKAQDKEEALMPYL